MDEESSHIGYTNFSKGKLSTVIWLLNKSESVVNNGNLNVKVSVKCSVILSFLLSLILRLHFQFI